MLQLKPNCECCDRDLPANSSDALICSYECTFCKQCVEDVLSNVCPNCGGGFCPRPIRPQAAYRVGVSLEFHKPSTERVLTKLSREEIRTFAETIKHRDPGNR
ncbi:MAG: DUF1272 domain-containing protein [Pseudohongiellaceae bacterium]